MTEKSYQKPDSRYKIGLNCVENALYLLKEEVYTGEGAANCKSSKSLNCCNSKCRVTDTNLVDLL